VKTVAIFIFDDVEVLDMAGPFEVFGVAGGSAPLYAVHTVAESMRPVLARNKLSINPHFTFEDMPSPDILVLPGGYGTRREKHKPGVLAFIRKWSASSSQVVSVCSGALLLAKAGLLDGLHATTHRLALAELADDAPGCTLLPKARVVDNGKFVISAGVAMGIEASLYTLAKQHGQAVADATALYMEYDWPHRIPDGERVVSCT
jgi:transcriptional regulator GlxA family with amidase domain